MPTEWPDVRCPACRAAPGEPCITQSGNAKHTPHKARTMPRITPKDVIPQSSRMTVGRRSGGQCEFERDGSRCPRRAVHMHHKRMRSLGGGHEPENLAHVCTTHHSYIHAYQDWSHDNGYLTRAGDA